MTQHSELLLKSDQVRAVNRVDVATDQSGEANVSIEPTGASLELGGSNPQANGEITVRNTTGTDVATLSGSQEAGTLQLNDASGDAVVTLDAAAQNQTSEIEVRQGGDVTTRVENTNYGGRVAVRNSLQSATAVDMVATGNGGTVRVTKLGGKPTGELRGQDASLFLNHDQKSGLSAAGGGEIVIGNRTSPTDLHVHATGKFDSSYGLENGHRPRIFLNGPEATMELGRDTQDSGAEAKHGQVLLRDDRGDKMLELRATEDSGSEVVFRWSDGGTAVHRGTIEAVEDGLMFRDAGGDDALLIANNGEIRTAASSIDEGGLSP